MSPADMVVYGGSGNGSGPSAGKNTGRQTCSATGLLGPFVAPTWLEWPNASDGVDCLLGFLVEKKTQIIRETHAARARIYVFSAVYRRINTPRTRRARKCWLRFPVMEQ